VLLRTSGRASSMIWADVHQAHDAESIAAARRHWRCIILSTRHGRWLDSHPPRRGHRVSHDGERISAWPRSRRSSLAKAWSCWSMRRARGPRRNNYYPFLWRLYASHRPTLFRIWRAITMKTPARTRRWSARWRSSWRMSTAVGMAALTREHTGGTTLTSRGCPRAVRLVTANSIRDAH